MSAQDSPSTSLLLRQDLDAPLLIPCAGGDAAVYSRSRPSGPGANEDGAVLLSFGPGRGVLAVADGAGGHASGADAAEAALRALEHALGEPPAADAVLRPLVLDGIERAGEAVSAVGAGAATTLAAVEIDDGGVRPYHVGDSEILIVGQRGRIRLQTVPHSPTGYGVESGLMDAEEAIGHEDRHVVSNVIGAPDMRIEIGPTVRLRPRDTVLLATDGLFDNLRLEEIIEVVRRGPLDKAAAALVSRVEERMQGIREGEPSKPDDLTFVLWRPRPTSPRPEIANR